MYENEQEDFNWLKWFIVVIIILAALSPLAWAAPAPQPKSPPPLTPGPGVWVLEWAGTRTAWEFSTDGKGICKCLWGGEMYRGSWSWDVKTRTLHIHETKDGKVWNNWTAVLEPITNSRTGREVGLMGTAVYGSHRTPIKLHKARFAVPEQVKATPRENYK